MGKDQAMGGGRQKEAHYWAKVGSPPDTRSYGAPKFAAGGLFGCAGGVLRDILCNDVPLLFRSELYASVSVVTGLFYATAFGLKLNDEVWTALTFVLGLSFRLLAIRYKWEMPKFVFNSEKP